MCVCVGGLCSPSTEVCLGQCPALLPGPVHCSSVIFLAVCLSVCPVFVVSKGSISVSAPPARPHPLPAHGGPWFSLIYLSKGTLSPPLPRWLQGTEVLAITVNPLQNLERKGSCCGSVEGRSPWRAPPRAEIGWQGSQAGSESSVTELQSLPQTPICCLLSVRVRGVSACKVCGRRATPVTVSPLPVLCFLCATEPSLCCRSASVLESPGWEHPNLNRKPK